MADCAQSPRQGNGVGELNEAKNNTSVHEPSPLNAGGAARKADFLSKIAQRISEAATSRFQPAQQETAVASSSRQDAAAPLAQAPKSVAEQLTHDLNQKYGLNLEYVRHHTSVDGKTREGHFLKAGEREFFWDPEKGTLLAWNAGTKQWEIKKDEGAGARFLASEAAQDLVARIVKQEVNQLANQSKTGQTVAIDPGAVLNAAATLKQDLQNYGATMVILDRDARARLSSKEAVIDAIAKICQKPPERRTAAEASLLSKTGVEPESFLKSYKMMCEARDSDLIVQKQNRAPDTTEPISFHRKHMVEHIVDELFSKRASRLVRRLERAPDPQALVQHFQTNGPAV
jgi:hypothetical protein